MTEQPRAFQDRPTEPLEKEAAAGKTPEIEDLTNPERVAKILYNRVTALNTALGSQAPSYFRYDAPSGQTPDGNRIERTLQYAHFPGTEQRIWTLSTSEDTGRGTSIKAVSDWPGIPAGSVEVMMIEENEGWQERKGIRYLAGEHGEPAQVFVVDTAQAPDTFQLEPGLARNSAVAELFIQMDQIEQAAHEHLAAERQGQKEQEVAKGRREAYTGWLERRGISPKATPRLIMTRRESELLRGVGYAVMHGNSSEATLRLIDAAKRNYGIPQDARYASVEVAPDDANMPRNTEVVMVDEEDFGTTVDKERFAVQGIESESIPRVTMSEREFELFKMVGLTDDNPSSLVRDVRDICKIPQDDQYAPHYAFIDLPGETLLIDITEAAFGEAIDADSDDEYFKSPDPDSPLSPESGANKIVDIEDALTDSWYDLRTFASELMEHKTENPLEGRFWVRAGGIPEGQEDAYVRENYTSVADAVELTLAFPGQYGDGVYVVTGNRQDAGNNKPGMAQVKDPTVLLAIEGQNLKLLQDAYRNLYRVPDFALTPAQRSQRDELFNNYLFNFISGAAESNRAYKDDGGRQAPLSERSLPR